MGNQSMTRSLKMPFETIEGFSTVAHGQLNMGHLFSQSFPCAEDRLRDYEALALRTLSCD
jgi:hypothetical protein